MEDQLTFFDVRAFGDLQLSVQSLIEPFQEVSLFIEVCVGLLHVCQECHVEVLLLVVLSFDLL